VFLLNIKTCPSLKRNRLFIIQINSMNTKILIIWLLCSNCVTSATAQNSFIKGRWNGKFGIYWLPKADENSAIRPAVRFEANYGVSKYIEAGLYAGAAFPQGMIYKFTDNSISGYGTFTVMPTYGINVNFHPLPLLIEKENFRFDLFIAAKLGGHYCSIAEGNVPTHGNMAEYGLGLGFSFYIFQHWGLFAEYSYGQYDYFDEAKFSFRNPVPPTALRYGLTMKFK
jgi:hypothetical protein